jgi:hypothetical protein
MTKKCIKQFAPNAERNVQFPSSQMVVDQYTAENVIPSVEPKEEDFKLTQ